MNKDFFSSTNSLLAFEFIRKLFPKYHTIATPL